jgi:hypothetical protein
VKTLEITESFQNKMTMVPNGIQNGVNSRLGGH